MSSAILYVAIVAIWACVLIPRWLHRDSARGASSTADTQLHDDVLHAGVVIDEDAEGEADADDVPAETEAPSPVHVRYTETFRADVTVETEAAPEEVEEVTADEAEDHVPPQLTPEESRRRMLAARRRLLGMLATLEVAAIALAAIGLAALWVLIPPSIMLAGYLLLLREAAQADAERAAWLEEAAHAQARAQTRARERAAPAPAAPPAPAARYEDSGQGRDFAPGLAGKYTTSNAEVIDIAERDDDDLSVEYAAQTLRAVGD